MANKYRRYIAPICTVLLAGILLYDAYNHMEGIITVLMKDSPLEFEVEELEENLIGFEGVIKVHDIFVINGTREDGHSNGLLTLTEPLHVDCHSFDYSLGQGYFTIICINIFQFYHRLSFR